MHRYLFRAAAVVLAFGVMGATYADDRDHGRWHGTSDFVGLWQAIDSYDGSTQLLSITCEGRRSCDVRLNDTSFGLSCVPSGRGFARGIGSISAGTLTVDLVLTCAGSDDPPQPPATHPAQTNLFVLDPRNGTLTNINDDEVPEPRVFNVFHRISR